MVSRFDEVQHLMDPEKEAPVAGLRAGPCGRGPVEEGASVLSMQIWLYQQRADGSVAMASGRGGEDARGPDERPPYDGGRWMIRCGLDEHSGVFSTELPASALALAIVRGADGRISVEQWNQEVRLHGGGHHHHDGGEREAQRA